MEVKLVQETCCTDGCTVMFWVSESYQERKKSRKESFYCPNGHSMVYLGESLEAKAQRLEREKIHATNVLRDKESELDQRNLDIEKLQRKITRLKKKSQ